MDSTESLLVGTWRWIDSECNILSGSPYPRTVFENDVFVQFNLSHTYEVIKDGHVLREGIWKISTPPDGQLFLMETTNREQSDFLMTGFVLFCEDLLEIDGSYRGDCNQFYRRLD